MTLIFLMCWTLLFVFLGLLIYKKMVSRMRVYLLILLNLFFLTTLFWLYPLVLGLSYSA